MAICKNCGQQVNDLDPFCGNCGAAIIASANTNVCSNCGNILQEEMTFCDKCGQNVEKLIKPEPKPVSIPRPMTSPVSVPNPTPVSPEHSSESSGIWGIVFAVLAPIIAWNWYSVLGVSLCVLSIIMGVKSKKNSVIAAGVISAVVLVIMLIYAYS